jgi:hypothetical protein
VVERLKQKLNDIHSGKEMLIDVASDTRRHPVPVSKEVWFAPLHVCPLWRANLDWVPAGGKKPDACRPALLPKSGNKISSKYALCTFIYCIFLQKYLTILCMFAGKLVS